MSLVHAQLAALRALYQPPATAIVAQLPDVGRNLNAALQSLGEDPTAARADTVALQLAGAAILVKKLREALARAASEGSD